MKPKAGCKIVGWIIAGLALSHAGCSGQLGDEFRDAAVADLESGVHSILTGLVDGAFAVYEPGQPEDTSGGGA